MRGGYKKFFLGRFQRSVIENNNPKKIVIKTLLIIIIENIQYWWLIKSVGNLKDRILVWTELIVNVFNINDKSFLFLIIFLKKQLFITWKWVSMWIAG